MLDHRTRAELALPDPPVVPLIKNQRIFFSGRKIYQRIIMVMRIPVINLSSLSKQSGAEIESMIEHLENGKYSVVCFQRMRLATRAATSDFAIEMQVQ